MKSIAGLAIALFSSHALAKQYYACASNNHDFGLPPTGFNYPADSTRFCGFGHTKPRCGGQVPNIIVLSSRGLSDIKYSVASTKDPLDNWGRWACGWYA
ncbi:hypothetical protein A1F99_114120 [Pyrenophora tritici-repentis]|nr:hypothetical protein A1F99_114120 [Pyrenophora tritici-repentis]KAI0580610.1 hypothetical protein Alg215_05102 [Pyrenophora tritici-repentis]